jgi:hypothetical protein
MKLRLSTTNKILCLLAITLIPLLSSCGSDEPDSSVKEFPSVPVALYFNYTKWLTCGVPNGFSIKIYDKDAQLPDNYPYSNNDATGVGGIAIVNGYSYITAYDVACPIECDANVKVSIDEYGIATCNKCGSKFNLLNGDVPVPIEGVAKDKLIGMHKYRVTVNRNKNDEIEDVVISS